MIKLKCISKFQYNGQLCFESIEQEMKVFQVLIAAANGKIMYKSAFLQHGRLFFLSIPKLWSKIS
ncbi:hypothetical protein KL86SPO_50538 [uncultured Sporomusa sp.]|uniref:Uncharacterized protein n=1 Tax=uncultured Sporomusa sp. TaxID=307249 RepID=A0A212LZ83_9FIRM|nr:hypothetical protein KL86SPO_50538 [uncultured Sporomusa sp.]